MSDQSTDPVAGHLEFLGYDTRATPDGWCLSAHPKRFNTFYKRFHYGWRFHASICFGSSLGDLRLAFLEGVNAMNEKSSVVKFTLNRDSDGDFSIRARAIFQADYTKKEFGAFMDTWHSDLELLSELPKVPEDEQESESDVAEARVVN